MAINPVIYADMSTTAMIDSALKLSPAERFELMDSIAHNLLDRIWIEEAERRLAAFRAGAIKGVPAHDVVGDF